jgi:hypothetical protein
MVTLDMKILELEIREKYIFRLWKNTRTGDIFSD